MGQCGGKKALVDAGGGYPAALGAVGFSPYLVSQREYAITCLGSKVPCLCTVGATTCAAIGLYNPTTHVALLGHADSDFDTKNLQDMLKEIGGNDGHVKAVICSDDVALLGLAKGANPDRVEAALKKLNINPIVKQSASLLVDAESGNFSYNVHVTSFTYSSLPKEGWEARAAHSGMTHLANSSGKAWAGKLCKGFDGRDGRGAETFNLLVEKALEGYPGDKELRKAARTLNEDEFWELLNKLHRT